ncbi:MAG: hypothetical protein K8I82_26300 [Anaerolineae bacterium]|nr:hypothetical protein [Anaerolineae bacterium]
MPDNLTQAQHYQNLVLAYEELDKKIDALMESVGGHTENMSPSDLQLYRQLAAERDELYNQIKEIEAGWLNDEQ